MDRIFVTKKYLVLEFIFDRTVRAKDDSFCPMSQKEIAKDMQISRATLNPIMRELQEKGYVFMTGNGRYSLSEQAKRLIKQTKKL